MKYLLLFYLTFVGSSILCYSQTKNTTFGIKAGVNYGSHGDIEYAFNNAKEDAESNIGYHIGVYGKITLIGDFYFRPELVFTSTKSDYDVTITPETDDFNMSKVDLPLLGGYNIIGPLSVIAGPSFQYIIDTDVDPNSLTLGAIENDLTVGFNFGVALDLGKLGVDVRYERGFSNNEVRLLQNNSIDLGTLDTRPEQLIFSVCFKLN